MVGSGTDDDDDGQNDVFGDDELFFSSVRVHLAPVPGTVHAYRHEEYGFDFSALGAAATIARRKPVPLSGFGSDLSVVVPCMPCLDPVQIGDIAAPEREGNSSNSSSNGSDAVSDGAASELDDEQWPQFLQQPLLKVPSDSPLRVPDEPKAVASGIRSACVKLTVPTANDLEFETRWYRLKGCGNRDQGFLVREEPALGWRDIRGSAFRHTALCELYNTTRIAMAIERETGIVGANRAMGYYEYDEPNRPLGPDFAPACIVEETLGDRRLGTHVLAGIELILDQLIDGRLVDTDSLLETFPPARPRLDLSHLSPKEVENEEPFGVPTTAMLMTDYCLAKMYELEVDGLTWDVPRDYSLFSNVLFYPFPERSPDPLKLPIQFFRDENGSEVYKPADCQWVELWMQACHQLSQAQASLRTRRESLSTSERSALPASVLAYLYSRLGFECGEFARELHKTCRISWGTYADSLCFDGQLHCNAHANNLVVNPPSTVPGRYLSYLDLDMAFDEATRVDAWGTGKVGADSVEHDALLFKEHCNFMEVIAGADASSGVPFVAHRLIEQMGDGVRLAKVALYDTMISSYLRAYTQDSRFAFAEYDSELHAAGYAIIRLAIITQAEYIA